MLTCEDYGHSFWKKIHGPKKEKLNFIIWLKIQGFESICKEITESDDVSDETFICKIKNGYYVRIRDSQSITTIDTGIDLIAQYNQFLQEK